MVAGLREKVRLQMLRGVSLRSEFESEGTMHSALSLRAHLRRAKARRAHTRGDPAPSGVWGGVPPRFTDVSVLHPTQLLCRSPIWRPRFHPLFTYSVQYRHGISLRENAESIQLLL